MNNEQKQLLQNCVNGDYDAQPICKVYPLMEIIMQNGCALFEVNTDCKKFKSLCSELLTESNPTPPMVA